MMRLRGTRLHGESASYKSALLGQCNDKADSPVPVPSSQFFLCNTTTQLSTWSAGSPLARLLLVSLLILLSSWCESFLVIFALQR